MPQTNALALALNAELSADGCLIYNMLSQRGKTAYFPSKGILGQSAEAKSTTINATIGTAIEEDGSPLSLECMEETINLPSESFLYMPSFGSPKLRTMWRKLMVEKNPSLAEKSFSQPVVTSALTHGLSVAGYLFLDPEDQVILPDLFWDNYELVFTEAYGAKLKFYNTFDGDSYNVNALAQALAGPVGKKVLLLNFPNNPTGYTITQKEADEIIAVLKKSADAGNQVVVLLDDAYFGLAYNDEVIKESLFAPLADLHENILAVKLDGPTKEDYVWGFRVGFITFAFKNATEVQLKALENKAAGVVRGTISNASSISQATLLKGYEKENYAEQKAQKFAILRRRFDKIIEVLAAHPEYAESFTPMPFNSGYFMCVRLNGADPETVRQVLIKDFSTGVIVLSGLVRLAFSAVAHTKIEQLFANLHAAVQKVKG